MLKFELETSEEKEARRKIIDELLCDTQIIDDAEFIEAEWELAHLLSIEKENKARIQQLRDLIISKCNGKPTKGTRISCNPIRYKGMIDYALIPELEGVDLEIYRKPGSTRWTIEEF